MFLNRFYVIEAWLYHFEFAFHNLFQDSIMLRFPLYSNWIDKNLRSFLKREKLFLRVRKQIEIHILNLWFSIWLIWLRETLLVRREMRIINVVNRWAEGNILKNFSSLSPYVQEAILSIE